jgi:predicted transcriptional regulator
LIVRDAHGSLADPEGFSDQIDKLSPPVPVQLNFSDQDINIVFAKSVQERNGIEIIHLPINQSLPKALFPEALKQLSVNTLATENNRSQNAGIFTMIAFINLLDESLRQKSLDSLTAIGTMLNPKFAIEKT